MTTTSIKKILNGTIPVDSQVTCQGWVRTRRDSKAGFSFINLHDGSCFDGLQIVVPKDLENYESEVLNMTTGCSVEVTGRLVESQGKGQSVEMQAEKATLVGTVENPDTYPLAPKRHSLEHLREVAHLRPRTNTIGAVTRVRHVAMRAIHDFLSEEGFFWVNTPLITASDTEGAGELFTVSTLDFANMPRNDKGDVDFKEDFFGRQSYLTVSGQLNVEPYCMAMSKVYTFGPTFRAENSNTSRHLAEFWMVEPEIAFADLMQSAELAERMLKSVFKTVLEKCSDDMAFFEQRIEKNCITRMQQVLDSKFETVDYSDAITELQKVQDKFEFPVEWGLDLQTEHERYLTDHVVKGPLVVANYPKSIKPFYMRVNDDDRTVAAMDVLAPGIGEIIGGSQREERLDIIDQRMAEMALDPEVYYWYRDLRRYGTVPHAGFGLGFERLLVYITGLGNIRDVIPYPRTPGNVSF